MEAFSLTRPIRSTAATLSILLHDYTLRGAGSSSVENHIICLQINHIVNYAVGIVNWRHPIDSG